MDPGISAGITGATIAASTVGSAAVVAEATKSSGVVVRVEAEALLMIIELNDEPLVVHATTQGFGRRHQYLTSYRGLAFYCKTKLPIDLPEHCQVVEAKKVAVPGM